MAGNAGGVKVWVEPIIWARDYRLVMTFDIPGGKQQRLSAFQFIDYDCGDILEENATIHRWPAGRTGDVLQALVDAAWEAGIRPSIAKIETDASQRHLNDMRKIAFKQLGIEG